jgi:ABC-type uncharacterized transport system ATPase subunit
VFLGREKTNGIVLDQKSMEAEVRRLSEKFGLEVDPTEITRDLSVGEAQRVEVLKALSHDTRLLILDEPTAVLTPQETDDMFVVVRDLAKQGVAVVFISHKLDEVLAIADEVTVIRDGKSIATLPAAGLSKEDIATMMVGREVLLRIEHTEAHPGDEVLRVDDLLVVDEGGRDRRHRGRRRQRPVRVDRRRGRHAQAQRRQGRDQGRRHDDGVGTGAPRRRSGVHP